MGRGASSSASGKTGPRMFLSSSLPRRSTRSFISCERARLSYFRSSRRAFVEEGFEAGVACAANGKARAVGENGPAAVPAIKLDAHHPLEIHHVRAGDAPRILRA